MVQRKLTNKVGIQSEHHVKSDKRLANMKLSSSQHQDGKNRDMKKKMKKSRSIKLSDLQVESLQTPSPSRKSGKVDGSPNYMKATSSSHAKKELFQVSHNDRNAQSSRKCSSDSQARCVSRKKPSKALTRSSSSLSLVRALTKTTSFKASRAPTCSSTLKDTKFPSYLMLTPGGTEAEGTSKLKVCPYTYCSLNGHRHAALPPLTSFVGARRRLLKTQKSMRLEALSPGARRSTKKEDSDREKNVFDAAKPAYDEIGMMDIFIEVYAKEKEAKPIDFVNEIEDQEDTKSTIEENEEIDTSSPLKTEIDLDEDFKKSFDDATDELDKNNKPIWSHEEISLGSYCSDGEHMEDIEMDDSDYKANDLDLEEEQFRGFDHEDDFDSSSLTEEENDHEEDFDSSSLTEEENESKVESLSESSNDISVTWLDNYYKNILSEETLKEPTEDKSNCSEEEPDSMETQGAGSPSNELRFDESSLKEESFEYLIDAEENGGEIEKEEVDEESETCKIDESGEDGCYESIDEGNQVHMFEVPEEHELLQKDQSKANKFNNTSCIGGGEEKNASKNWKCASRRKREDDDDDDDDDMRMFNPREPNFLRLVPEPDPERVDLRHQMIDERKNAEEWMIDCALRQAVTKLAPARKKKVALLVEAFETVMPMPKYETHMRNNSAFPHGRRIQACS